MATTFRSRSRRPGAVSVKKSLGQRRGVERVARWPRRQPRQVRQRARAPWAVGRFSTGRSARGSRATGVKRGDYDVSKPQPPTWRGVGEEEPRPTAWGGARRALAAKTTTPSPPARACSVGGRPVLHGAKRARAARHGSQTLATTFRSRSRRPGAVSVKKSLGQRRGVERVARWPRRQPRQVRQRARAPWAVGRFSTGRSARGPRATGVNDGDHDVRRRSRRPGAVSVKKSLGQRRGVERVARWPRRQPRQVSQRTRAPWAVGRFSTGRSARGSRATGSNTVTTTYRSRSRRPGAVSVKKSLGQRRGVERVARWPRRQPRQVRQRARAPWAVGRFSTGRSARGPRATGVKRSGHDVSKPQPPTWRGVGEEEPRPTAWGGARRALAAKTTTPSPPARACSVGGRPFSTGRSARGSRGTGVKRDTTTFRSRSRRPGAVSVKKSLGQRRGVERVARWPRRQPRQVRQRTRAPWAVGRFSTGRSARGPRATGVKRGGHSVSKPQPPTWRGVGEEEPRPTAWGGARRALAAKTTTPSPPARACSVGGRPVLHGAKRARVARHGSQTVAMTFEAAVADLARCR